jgi:hypothetical protein
VLPLPAIKRSLRAFPRRARSVWIRREERESTGKGFFSRGAVASSPSWHFPKFNALSGVCSSRAIAFIEVKRNPLFE